MQCDCYKIMGHISRCLGTKEMDVCKCGGDTNNCTFYPEKRATKKLNTAEMWLKAQIDGKTYQSNDVIYSKKTGLLDAYSLYPWHINTWKAGHEEDVCREIDSLMLEEWHEIENPIPVMTKAEAEQKFQIKISDQVLTFSF